MSFAKRGLGLVFAAGMFVFACMLTAAHADDKTYVMKFTLPTINEAQHQLAKNYAAAVERDSGGRIKTEIYPASQLGSIPRQIEGIQFGAIQCGIIPPEFFVGVDERFEVMAAPGLVDSMAHALRLSADPAVLKLMLGLGAEKGLHGVGMFSTQPSAVVSRNAIRHLEDFKGKKIRVFASQFQTEAMARLGATPVAMSLGDVLPALQQGAIDGALAGMTVFTNFHYQDAAKYVTETGQPAVFIIVEVSQKWYDTLPKDLQEIVDRDGAAESIAIGPQAIAIYQQTRKGWTDGGGELISLPPDEQQAMLETLASVGEDVSKSKPTVREAYEIVTAAAQRTRNSPGP
ncbi:MAG TPA: TRAP transporter substrate-binding protein [Xanthobacteraceae bacterium]|nr:TRAP transporter substrate-binding protein [Xanthobacteraceae bacterium]